MKTNWVSLNKAEHEGRLFISWWEQVLGEGVPLDCHGQFEATVTFFGVVVLFGGFFFA